MKTDVHSFSASEQWDRIFRSLDPFDEQAIIRFNRMVVAGQPEPRPADSVTC